jgi:hypothetical protein
MLKGLKMNKYYVRYGSILAVVLLLMFLPMIYKCSAQEKENSLKKEIDEFISCADKGQIRSVETSYLDWYVIKNMMPTEAGNAHPISMTWDGTFPLHELCKALKSFEGKKVADQSHVRLIIKFYDTNSREVLRISLSSGDPAVLINGKSYEPSKELLWSLRYYMPYIAYEQISRSIAYKEYFTEAIKKENDPNRLNK